MCNHVDLNRSSLKVDMHQVMNIVPLIQEKWAEIGTRLEFSSHQLNAFWQSADEYEIPDESKNTFCCIQMLKQWVELNDYDNAAVNELIKAIDEPYIGLKNKLVTIKTILTAKTSNTSVTNGEITTNPPEKPEQPYINMKAKFCLEISKSQCTIDDILSYLKVCNVKSEVFNEITDYPNLIMLLERYGFLSKTDLSWIKFIATSADCTKATETIETYERLLIADKIFWGNKHPKGRFLVGKLSKNPQSVTIKHSSDAKAVVSKIFSLKEIESKSESSEIGSVIFYWKIITDVTINIPKFINASLAKECITASLTHVGLMIDGKLDMTSIEKLAGM